MNFKNWKEKEMSVVDLLLDPLNPRIPPSDEQLDQRSLIADLVFHDKVFDLAKSIVDNGYFPVELLIVIKDNDKYYVVEGNRRLAALRLLVNPSSAPTNQVKKFAALSSRIDIESVKKVKVIIAPSREAATPIIMSRHTKVQIESWEPLMKAKYYRQLLKGGMTEEGLSGQYGVPPQDIVNALKLYEMYQIACSLDLPDDVGGIVRNPRDFPATTLQRFYDNQFVQDFLGIEFNEQDKLTGRINVDEFKKGFGKIVSDIARGAVTTRHINKREDAKKYLNSFAAQDAPDKTKKGWFDSDTLINPTDARKGVDIKKEPVKEKQKRSYKQKGLFPGSLPCEIENQRINKIFKELRKLSVEDYPNAIALLFRSLFEMCLYHYFQKTGELTVLIQKERERREKKHQSISRDWQPPMSLMIKHLISDDCKLLNDPSIIKVLEIFISSSDAFFSKDSLDTFVHSKYYNPTEPMLRHYWGQLEDLMRLILKEPKTSRSN